MKTNVHSKIGQVLPVIRQFMFNKKYRKIEKLEEFNEEIEFPVKKSLKNKIHEAMKRFSSRLKQNLFLFFNLLIGIIYYQVSAQNFKVVLNIHRTCDIIYRFEKKT
ncbi:hypothetical protein BpHYR1_007247 [Brachionus plicatilis]|uniref:Uncharacterized protein n=1 Tax=Brachionus plicatilis TaxID=10195 RepID=A0A3M7T845_BRAPC|nr:hypothetical protein BpHYR1_007247 [Brachionus plicatilis]